MKAKVNESAESYLHRRSLARWRIGYMLASLFCAAMATVMWIGFALTGDWSAGMPAILASIGAVAAMGAYGDARVEESELP